MTVSKDAIQTATYRAHVVELHDWLAQVQDSLQRTLVEVKSKLEDTGQFLADSPEDKPALPETLTALRSPPDCAPILKPESADQHAMLPGAVPCSKSEKVEEVVVPVRTPETPSQSALHQAALPSQKHPDVPSPPSTSLKIKKSESQIKRMSAMHNLGFVEDGKEPKRDWGNRAKDCLLFLTCSRRMKPKGYKKPKAYTYKDVAPTKLFELTEKGNIEKPLKDRLSEARKTKLVPERLWEPRVIIQDASLQSFSLKDLTKPELSKHMNFPVEVCWKWIRPDELPQIRRRDKVWWKVMGLVANNELRGWAMRFEARVYLLVRKARRLADGFIADQEAAEQTGTGMDHETSNAEIQIALSLLTEVDDLLVLGFMCDSDSMTIGEIAEAAGCSWAAFVQTYMLNRNNACKATQDRCTQRRDLVGAAIKAVDGLETLNTQLMHQIDVNDLLFFKYGLLVLNLITCAAQFTWSKYIHPAFVEPTPMPTWQQQIATIYNSSTGG